MIFVCVCVCVCVPDKAGSDNVIYRYKYVNNLVETGTEL